MAYETTPENARPGSLVPMIIATESPDWRFLLTLLLMRIGPALGSMYPQDMTYWFGS